MSSLTDLLASPPSTALHTHLQTYYPLTSLTTITALLQLLATKTQPQNVKENAVAYLLLADHRTQLKTYRNQILPMIIETLRTEQITPVRKLFDRCIEEIVKIETWNEIVQVSCAEMKGQQRERYCETLMRVVKVRSRKRIPKEREEFTKMASALLEFLITLHIQAIQSNDYSFALILGKCLRRTIVYSANSAMAQEYCKVAAQILDMILSNGPLAENSIQQKLLKVHLKTFRDLTESQNFEVLRSQHGSKIIALIWDKMIMQYTPSINTVDADTDLVLAIGLGILNSLFINKAYDDLSHATELHPHLLQTHLIHNYLPIKELPLTETQRNSTPLALVLLQRDNGPLFTALSSPLTDLSKEGALHLLQLGLASHTIERTAEEQIWKGIIHPLLAAPDCALMLRRRIPYLLESFTPSDEVFDLLYRFLAPEESMLVKRAAVTALADLLNARQASNGEQILRRMLELIASEDADEGDDDDEELLLVLVLEVVGLLIEGGIAGMENALITFVQKTWNDVDEDQANIVRAGVLRTTESLLEALADSSTALHPFLLPIVDEILKQTSHPLFEDVLPLLLVLLRTTPTPLTTVDFVGSLLASIEIESESLLIVLEILESYLLLEGPRIMNAHGGHILAVMARMLFGDGKDPVHALISFVPSAAHACINFLATLIKLFSKNIQTIVSLNEQLWVNTMICMQSEKVHGACTAKLIALVARWVIYTGGTRWIDTVGAAAAKETINVWISKFDIICDWPPRKLTVLAIASLLVDARPDLNKEIAPMVGVMVEILEQIEEAGGENRLTLPPRQEDFFLAEHQRRAALLREDIVSSVSLPQVIQSSLGTCSSVLLGRGVELKEVVVTETDEVVWCDLERLLEKAGKLQMQ